MRRLKYFLGTTLVALAAGCSSDSGSPVGPVAGPSSTVSDAAHAGAVPGFYFLPPMVAQPVFSGTFDAAISPRVEVCELAGTSCGTVIAQFTMSSGSGSELVRLNAAQQHYAVNWHTDLFGLDPAKHYRITVFVGSFRLGYADLDVVSSGKELKNVDNNEYIPLVDGRTLPVKFRIETGIVAEVAVSPANATIQTGQTQQFTAALTDLHGNPVVAPVTWATSSAAVATIDATGLATGVAPGTVTITATSGGASGTATLVVLHPNTPPVPSADAFDAIGNVTVPVAAPGVLANDTDAEDNALAVVPGTFATTAGGTVTIAADGSFTYLSAAGFTGTDSFEYEVTDGTDSATGTVTMTADTRVWYVSNDAAAPGDGRDASPFATLSAAEAASAAGETIFLLAGDGTTTGYDGGITLKAGQALTGQGVGTDITAILNGQAVVLLDAGSAPSITRVSVGTTVQLATGNTVQGVNVASTAGAGIAGSGFGTFTAGNASVNAVGGPALDLQTGSVAASFGGLSSSNSTGAGLRLHGVSGTLSAGGGSITGAAGAGVDVSGGIANVSYAGDIANSAGRAVSVTGRTGGALTLSGSIQETGTGILVSGNTGGTIAFTGPSKTLGTGTSTAFDLQNNAGATVNVQGGGLAITTTSGNGFSAVGGGTVNVTGAGNTIVSGTGRALNLQSTSIGALGVTFRSISANGGSYGIFLDGTGAAGGFKVTGDGSTQASGGTIQNTSVAGISLTGAYHVDLAWMSLVNANSTDGGGAGACDGSTNAGCNGAVKLNAVQNVTLDRLAISGSAEQGINGINVTGLTLSNSTITGAGNAVNESGIYIFGLFGTTAAGTASSITNTSVTGSGSANHNVFIRNSTATNAAPGAPDRLLISGSSFVNPGSAALPSDGITVSLRGTANFQTVVQNSSFTQATLSRGTDGIQVVAADNSRSDVSITGSTFTGWNQAPINLSAAGTATTTFDVSGNPTISGGVGNGVSVVANGDAEVRGTIASNPNITTPTAGNNGTGINLEANNTAAVVVDVDGNTVTGFSHGLRGTSREAGTAEADLTIRNNTITAGGSFAFVGAYLTAGNGDGQPNRMCVNLANNRISTGGNPFAYVDYLLEQWTGNTFQLQGLAPAAGATQAQVEAFVASLDLGTPTVEAFGGTVVNYTAATCAAP